METTKDFVSKVKAHIEKIDPSKLLYNENEFWLIQKPYEYLEYFAMKHRLLNTSIALEVVRGLHNGSYRKYGVHKNGEQHRLPYYIHCLMVCKMLSDLPLNLSNEDLDILLASALCHDLIEDYPFKNGGKELVDEFELDPRVLETVKTVSKRKDFTLEEEIEFFNHIQNNVLCLLIKLSDRGNNVEDLYNMSEKKFMEYIEETNRYFVPMSDYGLVHYPKQATAIGILKDKILTLTNVSDTLIHKLEKRNQHLREERSLLILENRKIRSKWQNYFSVEYNSLSKDLLFDESTSNMEAITSVDDNKILTVPPVVNYDAQTNQLRDVICPYATKNQLQNTLNVISILEIEMEHLNFDDAMKAEYYIHGVSMAFMILELHLPISNQELDIMLAASICHILCEIDPEYPLDYLAMKDISKDVILFVQEMIQADKRLFVSNNQIVFEKLLFMIKLVERCNLIQHLCDMSTEEAKLFIVETKRYLIPMALEGKAQYPEFADYVSVLLEKMRTLIQIADILFRKYDAEEEELYEEILELKEENFRILEAFRDL